MESPEGDPGCDHEAGREPDPAGMPKSNDGDHHSAEAHTDCITGTTSGDTDERELANPPHNHRTGRTLPTVLFTAGRDLATVERQGGFSNERAGVGPAAAGHRLPKTWTCRVGQRLWSAWHTTQTRSWPRHDRLVRWAVFTGLSPWV